MRGGCDEITFSSVSGAVVVVVVVVVAASVSAAASSSSDDRSGATTIGDVPRGVVAGDEVFGVVVMRSPPCVEDSDGSDFFLYCCLTRFAVDSVLNDSDRPISVVVVDAADIVLGVDDIASGDFVVVVVDCSSFNACVGTQVIQSLPFSHTQTIE